MDLARLGFDFDGQGAAAAERAYDRLEAGARGVEGATRSAERATDRLADAARQAGGAAGTMNVAMRQQAMVLTTARAGMGLTAAEGLNMSRQFADIGVTAAMGMNPLMIALQQGPQLMDIFQQAAARSGASIVAVMRGVAVATWSAMAPLLPFIAAVGAAAAAIGGTLSLATRALNKDVGDLTDGMGLTSDQLDNVKNRGVTMGDVLGGTFDYLRDIIWDKIGPAVTAIGDWFTRAMDVATRALISATKAITGGFIGSFRAIRAVWGQLPAVIGDLAVGAANATIRAVEGMINGAVRGINTVLAAARALGAINPAFRSANQISDFTPVDLTEMNNPNAGAARAAGRTMAAEYAAGMAEGLAMVDRQFGAISDAIEGRGRGRIRGEAGEDEGAGSANRGGPAIRQAREVAQVMEQVSRVSLQPLTAVVEMVNPLRTVADEMRLIDTLAQDTARGLASSFGESGRALGNLLTVMSGYQARMAEISLAESESSLSRAQADRERAMAQVQNYGDMLGAAKGFFKEGSDGYKALQAAEQAYRVFQFAMMIQSMVMDTQQTTSAVGNSMTRGAAAAAEGAARIFAMLGPFAFPVVAGMVALLATFGLRNTGGSGRPSESANQEGATATARNQASSTRANGQAFVQSLAQSVEIRVTADRDGLNAYVEGTAARVAAPMAAQAAAGAYGATRADAASAQRRGRQRFT